MEKIIMLGTGMGTVLDLYNTCFVIQNNKGNFLVDAGGSIEIVKRLKQVNIELMDIKNIFISHAHTDHILGFIWMIKGYFSLLLSGKEISKVNVYCNEEVYEAILAISTQVLSVGLLNKVNLIELINFHILNDKDQFEINGINYTFFDALARGNKLYGFECMINDRKLVFLGDEPINSKLYEIVKDADYVMHEAFCLDKEEHLFNAHAKNHSTVKDVSEVMNNLGVKNLILYHTEESHGEERKKLYIEEGKKYFSGNVIVPDELEVININ